MKFSLGATILTGGIPVWRQVKDKISDRPVQIECFARLYDRKSSEQSIELLQHRMNYSFLGTKKAPSSLANFDIVVKLLRELFPQAIFDDRLMKLARRNEPPEQTQHDLEINCKLLYLYHLATKRAEC
jgi:hypothetical protein